MCRLRRIFWTWVVLGSLFFAEQGASAQSSVTDYAITGEMRALAGHAALIFVGQIVSIQRQPGVVAVKFRVEQPVSGTPGATYVMREWAGLWPPDHFRYSVGQRVLAFVHAASVAGFNSPVHGPEGLIPVVVQGANAPALLDIRRVAASVARPMGSALPSESNGAIPLKEALATLTQAGHGGVPQLTRLPIPIRAHPPAAMDPTGGLNGLAPSYSAAGFNPARPVRTGGSQAHVVR